MHNTARWTARRSYVVLAFILIILALILAGCASVDQETKGTGAPATLREAAAGVAIVASASSQSERTRPWHTR